MVETNKTFEQKENKTKISKETTCGSSIALLLVFFVFLKPFTQLLIY